MVLEEGLHDSDDKQSKTSQMELGRGWNHRAKGIMGFVGFFIRMLVFGLLQVWMVPCLQLESNSWGHF